MLAVCALNFPSIIHHEAADGPDVQDSQAAAEASRQRISKGMRLPIQLYLRSCHRVFVSEDELHDDFIPDFPSWDAWDDGAPWEPSIFDYALGEDFELLPQIVAPDSPRQESARGSCIGRDLGWEG